MRDMTGKQQPWDEAWNRLDQHKSFGRLSSAVQLAVYHELIKMWYAGYEFAAQEARDDF